MSDDDDAIEPLFDSEVESKSEFESPVIRRKRINATLKSSAHQVPQLATHRMKAKLNTAKIKNCTGKESECSNTKEKRSSPPHSTEGSLFADDDDIDPFTIAREK